MSGEGSLSAKRKQQQTSPSRKRRSDAGTTEFNERDEYALTWIGLQYGIRLDHLQWLLGRFPGKDAAHSNWISEGAARDVVERWKLGKWVQQARIRAHEPFWVWPTRLGLRKIGLPYSYRDLARTGLDDLNHLYAMNEIRINLGDDEEATQWISERQLLQGLIRDKGRDLLHRVFVNDIGDHFRIRIGAMVPSECDTDNEIWGPFDNEKRAHTHFVW